jgi:hypothetical protein
MLLSLDQLKHLLDKLRQKRNSFPSVDGQKQQIVDPAGEKTDSALAHNVVQPQGQSFETEDSISNSFNIPK